MKKEKVEQINHEYEVTTIGLFRLLGVIIVGMTVLLSIA